MSTNEWALYKPRLGAFYNTNLEGNLREREVNTVIVAGCNFPNCPHTTMYEASERDFRIVFVQDATSGVYEKGLEELAGIGVTVMKADEVEHLKRSLQGTKTPGGLNSK